MGPELVTGTMLGRYRLVRRLGQGAFCDTWLAHHVDVARLHAAIKLPKAGTSDGARAMLAREADLLARFAHTGIPRVLEVELGANPPWLAIEHVDGRPLAEVVAGGLDQWSALRVWDELLGVLEHVHDKGVVHRDLKPANVLVDPEGHPHLVDFGLGADLAGEDALDHSLDSVAGGRLVGTPRYMAPEQREGARVDARADLYAAGLILFELLVGRTPGPGERPGMAVDDPSARRRVDELYARLVAPLDERFANADQARAALAHAFGSLALPMPVAATPVRDREAELPVLTPAPPAPPAPVLAAALPPRVRYFRERTGCGFLLGMCGLGLSLMSGMAIQAGAAVARPGLVLGLLLSCCFAWQRRVPYARCPRCRKDSWIERTRGGRWRCRDCGQGFDALPE